LTKQSEHAPFVDPELARLAAIWGDLPKTLRRSLARWPELPKPIQAAVLALVNAR
jgi:hypothetical protein